MPQTENSQPTTAEFVEPKDCDVVQADVGAVLARRSKRKRCLPGEPEAVIGVLNVTHKRAGFRLIYPVDLARDLVVSVALLLPPEDCRMALAEILDRIDERPDEGGAA